MHTLHSLSRKIATLSLVVLLMLSFFATSVMPAQAATLTDLANALNNLQTAVDALKNRQQGTVLAATVTTVSNASELTTALNSATGGETILLNAGNYGVVSIRQTPSAKVTVSSRDANNPAVVTKLTIAGSYWHINNLDLRPVYTSGNQTLSNAVTITGSDVIFENSTVTYGNSSGWGATDWAANAGSGIIASNGTNVLIKNNHLKTVYMGISIDHTMSNAKVINNTVDGAAGDALRGRGDYGLFENNLILNMKQIDGNHSDCFQSWSKLDGVVGKGEVVGVVVRGNQCLAALNTTDPIAADTQGYSIFDGVARNWIVENNIAFSNTFHGSFLSGGNNSVIRNNTLIGGDGPLPNTPDGNAARARIGTTKTGIDPVNSKVQNNIVNRNSEVSDANVTYTNNVSAKYENYDAWFVDWRNGNFTLKASAPANGAGATPVATVGSSRTITNPSGGGTVTPPSTQTTPTLNLSSSASSITAGSASTLTWSSSNATACTATGSWTGSKSTNGSQSTGALSTVGTQTYSLSCTGTGGTVSKSVSVAVTSGSVVTPNPTPTVSIPQKTTWQWQLTGTIDQTVDAQLFNIDLFDTSESVIRSLRSKGKIVICYFSAGSYENWRSDANLFPASVIGNSNGWAGEKWLDISEIASLSPVMTARMDLAKAKGCSGLEADNVDGYTNSTGFTLTAADQIAYNKFLATEAHKRGLLIGLKNDVDQTTALEPFFDFAVNEQCFQYSECDTYQPFLKAGKAVFNVEYSLDVSRFCSQANSLGIMSMKKKLDLDASRTVCWTTSGTSTPTDTDRDTIVDTIDNCVSVANLNQANFDRDTQGDACDTDDDNDGVLDTAEKTGCSLNVNTTCGSTTTPPVVTSPFKIGDRIEVLKNVNVRTSGLLAATTLIGTNPQGSKGTLIAGPTATDDRYGKITWFNVNFDTGFDGWVGADNYKLITISTPTPTPTGTKVSVTDNVNVRATPNGTILGTQFKGAKGTQASTPAVTAGGYSWVQVNFDSGVDGYVVTNYLTTSTVAPTDTQAQINSLLQQLAQLQALLAQLLKAGG